jgi:hypothetical protein
MKPLLLAVRSLEVDVDRVRENSEQIVKSLAKFCGLFDTAGRERSLRSNSFASNPRYISAGVKPPALDQQN